MAHKNSFFYGYYGSKNRNFGQKPKFWSKIEFFLLKIQILAENKYFDQK